MDVLGDLGLWQLLELRPGERDRGVDLAIDAEVPPGEVRGVRGDVAGVEHRPLLGQVLPRREPRGVVARFLHLPLRSAPEHARYPRVDGRLDVTHRGPGAAYVSVHGPDAASYLNRMVSNDVEALAIGDACEALLLTPKARIVAPLVVWRRRDDDFLLLTEPDVGDRVARELLRSRFAAKCEIVEEEHRSVIVLGPPRWVGCRHGTTACRQQS